MNPCSLRDYDQGNHIIYRPNENTLKIKVAALCNYPQKTGRNWDCFRQTRMFGHPDRGPGPFQPLMREVWHAAYTFFLQLPLHPCQPVDEWRSDISVWSWVRKQENVLPVRGLLPFMGRCFYNRSYLLICIKECQMGKMPVSFQPHLRVAMEVAFLPFIPLYSCKVFRVFMHHLIASSK